MAAFGGTTQGFVGKPDPKMTTISKELTVRDIDVYRVMLREWLDAIAIVESNNNDEAVGDDGMALGAYQIHEAYWEDASDVCSQLGGEYKDVVNREYAERIVVCYMLRYCRNHVELKDYRRMSRVHNGGPRGHNKQSTVAYWAKVRLEIVIRRSF